MLWLQAFCKSGIHRIDANFQSMYTSYEEQIAKSRFLFYAFLPPSSYELNASFPFPT